MLSAGDFGSLDANNFWDSLGYAEGVKFGQRREAVFFLAHIVLNVFVCMCPCRIARFSFNPQGLCSVTCLSLVVVMHACFCVGDLLHVFELS